MKTKTFQLLIFSITIFLILWSCNKFETIRKNNDDKLLTQNAKKIVDVNNKFAFDFFKEVAKTDTNKNFMVSPVSLSLALGMAYNGADGVTKEAFENVLNYQMNTDEVNEFNKNIINKLSNDLDGSIMEIANSIWLKNDFPVKKEFIQTNQNYFSAEVQNLDFLNPNSVNIINNWVSEKTHDKIPTIIGGIDPADVLFLINAIYFNATWKHKFNPEDTYTNTFYIDNIKTSQVEMMQQNGSFLYLQNDLFSSVILPYEKEKFSTIILLPNEQKSIDDIIDEMNHEQWTAWLNSYMLQEQLDIRIPKFKSGYKNMLNDELQNLGLGIAFSENANFNKISDISLLISSVLQKTFIDVNEEGTEAAAVTALGQGYSINNYQFLANKPFIYIIKENLTGSICFIGKVGNPTYEN